MVERKEFFKGQPQEKGLFESVDEVHMGRSRPALPASIEFRRKVRSWFSFPYSYLVAVEYAPSGTEEQPKPHVAVYFSGYKVTLFGSNLGGIYQDIRAGTLESLAEMDRSEVMQAEDGSPIVEAIWIEEA